MFFRFDKMKMNQEMFIEQEKKLIMNADLKQQMQENEEKDYV